GLPRAQAPGIDEGGAATDYTLNLGSNQFIPGFEEGIVGHKAGEEFDLNLKFPKEYHSKDLAGKDVVFTVTLKTINELELPEVDDAFAKKAGPFKTAAEFKADIKREIAEQKNREAIEKRKDDLVQRLIDKSTVPVPEVLLQDQIRSIRQDFEQNLAYRGLTLDMYIEQNKFKDETDWLEKEVKPTAVKRVQAGLVLAELSKAENITATDEEFEQHLNLYKQQYGNSPEIAKQFEDADVRRDIGNRLLTEKTVDRLLDLNS
ncbi:MAG TPA: trigger factor, partial [Candidatus Saccharibacteria bacterium]|nr:trigger factor [Candidatus Saccharibacteria bacterium]